MDRACRTSERSAYMDLVGKHEGDNWEELGVNWKTILKLFLSSMGQCGLDSCDSYYGQMNTVLNSRDAQNAGDS